MVSKGIDTQSASKWCFSKWVFGKKDPMEILKVFEGFRKQVWVYRTRFRRWEEKNRQNSIFLVGLNLLGDELCFGVPRNPQEPRGTPRNPQEPLQEPPGTSTNPKESPQDAPRKGGEDTIQLALTKRRPPAGRIYVLVFLCSLTRPH